MRLKAYWMGFKKILRSSYFLLVSRTTLLFFTIVAQRTSRRKIVFIDIDNTIADTWPSLLNPLPGRSSEKARLSGLQPLVGSLQFIEEEFSQDYLRVYLTHRPYLAIPVTLKWLRKNAGLKVGEYVFFVQKPQEKLLYFRAVSNLRKFKEISIMDDLSYAHEQGYPRFYTDMLEAMDSSDYRYIGYHQIQELNRLVAKGQ